jgi:prohibitin 1
MIDNLTQNILAIKTWLRSNLLGIILSVTIAMAAAIVLWPVIVHVIPAGGLGVLYRPLFGGVDTENTLDEGVHIIWPWNKLTEYTVRIQKLQIDIDILTKDQLKTQTTVVFQYELDPKTLGYLHKYIGPDYEEKIIIPEVTEIVRQNLGKKSASEAFTSDLAAISSAIVNESNQAILKSVQPAGLTRVNLVHINSVQITKISFPKEYEDAIQQKVTEQQKAEGLTFVVEGAKREAERKVIEAGGIRDFQDLIKGGLTENYLRFVGIQASSDLAKSNNAKIVVFGSGPSGLPLIFDDNKNVVQKGK